MRRGSGKGDHQGHVGVAPVKEVADVTRIVNRLGLHARPAAEFVKLATRFESEVWVEKDGLEVNGKSIMGVMMLAAEPGAEIRIRVVGADAEAALDALLDLVRRGFDDHELEKDLEAGGGTP